MNKMQVTELGSTKTFIANTSQLDTIGELRYQAYFSAKAIDKLEDQIFLDKYDHQSNSINHIATYDDEIVGAIRGCIYDPTDILSLSIPALEIFNRELETEVGLESKIFESCRFVVHPTLKKAFYTNIALIKSSCLLSYISDCDHSITAVRESHVGFYEKMGFHRCSDPKVYPGLKIKMVLLLAKQSKSLMDNYKSTFKLLAQTESERKNYLACLGQLH